MLCIILRSTVLGGWVPTYYARRQFTDPRKLAARLHVACATLTLEGELHAVLQRSYAGSRRQVSAEDSQHGCMAGTHETIRQSPQPVRFECRLSTIIVNQLTQTTRFQSTPNQSFERFRK